MDTLHSNHCRFAAYPHGSMNDSITKGPPYFRDDWKPTPDWICLDSTGTSPTDFQHLRHGGPGARGVERERVPRVATNETPLGCWKTSDQQMLEHGGWHHQYSGNLQWKTGCIWMIFLLRMVIFRCYILCGSSLSWLVTLSQHTIIDNHDWYVAAGLPSLNLAIQP